MLETFLTWAQIASVVLTAILLCGMALAAFGMLVAGFHASREFAQQHRAKRQIREMASPEMSKWTAIESYKHSLICSLEIALAVHVLIDEGDLDATFECSAPLAILEQVPDLAMPKQLDLLVDVEMGEVWQRHYFRLNFKRVEQDNRDELWAFYEAVC